MPRKAITEKDYSAAVRRLKEKKEHKTKRFRVTEADVWEYPSIGVGLIAKELKCNPSTLYKTTDEKIRQDIKKYQKINRKNTEDQEPARNTKAYYKNLADKYRKENEMLKQNAKKVKSERIRHIITKDALVDTASENTRLIKEKRDLEEEIILLKEKNIASYSETEFKRLSSENAKLREVILRNGLKVQF